MRPLLKPGLRRLWRAGGDLQVGATPGRSLLLTGLAPAATRFVAALDGSRDVTGVLAHAAELGVGGGEAATLLDVLARAGFLDDAGYDPGILRGLDPVELERLRPDLASLALGFLVPGGAVRAMARRRTAVVAVYGCGRVGAAVANMLAASGVGCVVPYDGGPYRPEDAGPAGCGAVPGTVPRPRAGSPRSSKAVRVSRADAEESARENSGFEAPETGTPRSNGPGLAGAGLTGPPSQADADPAPRALKRQEAVRDLLRATSPTIRTTLPANRQHPDLAVLAPAGDPHPALAEALHAAAVPHLPAEVHETTGVLGPFVMPGRTSCLRCRDLHRTGRDPGWPRAAAPLSRPTPGAEQRACDVLLATQTAVLTAMNVLAHIEGEPLPTAGATYEISLPFLTQVRRERPVHPECGCSADRI